ncbi:MAG: Magnesium transporter MgtE [Alphaproteobacteria bacterium MarineAlpha5_Bin2]|nr:MAG: Magnesium transporter MgtE [Alphaproteobacteria bacterium MarineAlpha5_Bin2]HIA60378.1 magnesium transporter [Pelagibacterales bacterium]
MNIQNNTDHISNEDNALDLNLKKLHLCIAKDNSSELIQFIKDLHNADIAEIIQNLDDDTRLEFIKRIKENFDPEILTYLNESIREEIIELLDIKQLATNASELDVDDAVDVIEDLEESDQEAFLDNLPESERKLIEEGLNYPEDSAGRLMQRKFVPVSDEWNVGETIDFLRTNTKKLPEDFYEIYLTNEDNKISGIVPLGRLMGSNRIIKLENIKHKITRTVNVFTDQEEVAYQFNKYAMVSAPVVNENNEIIGSVTVDDVVDVIEEEREEDILKLGGVGQTDIYDAVIDTTKSRFSWLLVNLLTAIIASIVIGFFQASIEKVVALAVLMPIVASMGGNAGTQTLTVSVRALAMKELTASNAFKIVSKETFVGGINGFIFALIIGLLSAYWFEDTLLGFVIALAMILNLIIAGLAGTLIPLTLNKFNIDPALASGVILTTITDVFGFLSFLGLATIVII